MKRGDVATEAWMKELARRLRCHIQPRVSLVVTDEMVREIEEAAR